MPDFIFDSAEGLSAWEAANEIVFKVGDNSISLTPTGVVIKALKIEMNSQLLHTIDAPSGAVVGQGSISIITMKAEHKV